MIPLKKGPRANASLWKAPSCSSQIAAELCSPGMLASCSFKPHVPAPNPHISTSACQTLVCFILVGIHGDPHISNHPAFSTLFSKPKPWSIPSSHSHPHPHPCPPPPQYSKVLELGLHHILGGRETILPPA